MTESAEHRSLVTRLERSVAAALRGNRSLRLWVDNQSSGRRPPTIGTLRPDLYALADSIEIIGEAKPPWDIESQRTAGQLRVFARYAAERRGCHLILAVHWTSAGTSAAIVRLSAGELWPVLRDRVHILDGVRPLRLPRRSFQDLTTSCYG